MWIPAVAKLPRTHSGGQELEFRFVRPRARILHRRQEHRIGIKITILDHKIDLGDVHVNDPAGANVQVAHFAVAHLPLGQPHVASTGMDECVGKFLEQAIVIRLARLGNCVGLGWSSVAPSIQNNEDKSFVHVLHSKPKILNEAALEWSGQLRDREFQGFPVDRPDARSHPASSP